ncbi:hypothetical protein CAP35_04345 [Chitinophagaceae bacterium IBVUCB1]|nr:hypothetical protein CAP35_04345 [Chitinophagaceae bacterium IBVUCB1]
MASLQKLAGQTMWYGVSTIAARMLTFLLTPYLAYTLTGEEGRFVLGQYGYIYTLFPIMNVLYTYGMETSFFRFSKTEDNRGLYNTQTSAMLFTTLLFSLCLILFNEQVADIARLGTHTEYVGWCAAILGLDALSALPFAKLRNENRPRVYAFTKVAGIAVFVVTIVFLFSFGKGVANSNPQGWFAQWYHHHYGIGFILFANLLQAAITLLLLYKGWSSYKPRIDKALLQKVLVYGFPILITGFAGVINDSINRYMFIELHPGSDVENVKAIGSYSMAVRLATLINLTIQAFKMAAEPFFFSISGDKDARPTYARVMKWFVILMALMFLNVMLYLDVWKLFIGEHIQAIHLVPVMLMYYVFLGIYYNLTVWYKLTDKTYFGTYIMIIGSAVTIIFNWMLIPVWGYDACAWGTLVCYAVMMYLSFTWGQKYYPIPYEVGKMAKYLGVMLFLYAVQFIISKYTDAAILRIATGTVLFTAYLFYIYKQERTELKSFPVIGKYIR